MDYFELFELPVSLKTNRNEVLKSYYALSRIHHPDRAAQDQQDKAMLMTTSINEAKSILDDPHRRLEYLLEQKGWLPAEEKYQLPASFLGDMMDINEQLMELEFEANEKVLRSIREELQEKETALFNNVKEYFEADLLQPDESGWQALKLYYYQHKYLQRIADKLKP